MLFRVKNVPGKSLYQQYYNKYNNLKSRNGLILITNWYNQFIKHVKQFIVAQNIILSLNGVKLAPESKNVPLKGSKS